MGITVGIDLGTSYSCVASVVDGRPRVLSDTDGQTNQPSVVAFGFDGRPTVGWKAQRQLIYAPESTIRSPKRLMGRRFRSPEVKRLAANVGYNLVESPEGEVLVRVRDRDYTIPQVSGMVLAHMKDVAEHALDQAVTEAVVTVPAYFNDHQRQATREAARIAGFDCLRILNEPTAAALAYGSGLGLNENIAVYDLGAGTFDISILRLENDVFEVIGTAGDTFLGGDDFDAVVAKHLLDILQRRSRVTLKEGRVTWLRLLEASERAKMALGESNEVEVSVPGIARTADGLDTVVSTRIDRLTYAELVMPFVQRTFQVCDEALKLSGLSVTQIDRILLVGGMSRLFLMKEAVEQYFGRVPTADVDPHEVVALGAAIQADNLANATAQAPGTILLDVTPRTLGVATRGGLVEPLIARNSPIPTEASKYFHTTTDLQTRVRVAVYQGEARRVDENELLGEFVLAGLPPASRGEVRVRIGFQIDADGIVHVVAEEEATGNRRELAIQTTVARATDASEPA
jgi:molecular chaperone DnaK